MYIERRNYLEYNLGNVLSMTPDQFNEMVEVEVYSLVLMFRLIDLIENLEYLEEYLHCKVIQDWFDEHSITFRTIPDDDIK